METVLLDTVSNDPSLDTPTLILDFQQIAHTYDRFVQAFPGAHIDYAMKANANPRVVRAIVAKGGGLEIASLPELVRALEAGATPDRIICSHPFKNPTFLRRLHAEGVYAMVLDSVDEVQKIARYAPGSRVYVRLSVDNTGSVLPLAGKFGVDGATALDLFEQSREAGLNVIGLSFHVGSQCLSVANWANAIQACGAVWTEAVARGFTLNFLDIGGGYPAGHYHTPNIPTIEAIGASVMQAVADYIPHTPDLLLVLEPGRGLVGESGRLITTIVGKAARGTQTWLYLDVGVFNGMMETFEGFPPVVRVLRDEGTDFVAQTMDKYTLAGPSCDSCDVMARELLLPEVGIGDRLMILDTGAYTNEYAAAFNGFPIPEVVIINDFTQADAPIEMMTRVREIAFA